MRPVPGRWQGYEKSRRAPVDSTRQSVFDPRIIVFSINGKRASLPATLKLTAALRGLLMRNCPEQPPPEWFSGRIRGYRLCRPVERSSQGELAD